MPFSSLDKPSKYRYIHSINSPVGSRGVIRVTNLWLDEEETRRRVDETLDLFSPEREVIEEIVREDTRPSLGRRLTRALVGVGRNADDVLDVSEQVIVEP